MIDKIKITIAMINDIFGKLSFKSGALIISIMEKKGLLCVKANFPSIKLGFQNIGVIKKNTVKIFWIIFETSLNLIHIVDTINPTKNRIKQFNIKPKKKYK